MEKIKVYSKEELMQLIDNTIAVEGVKADLNFIDVSSIEDMSKLFSSSGFDGDISGWDVSNVKKMSGMFEGTSSFNGDISGWNVSNVENMNWMFFDSVFNGDISKWDVRNVKKMESVFGYSKFNRDISNWNVSGVETMEKMFSSSVFNGDISKWDVSNVENMELMFYNSKFNGDISNWNVSKVKNMASMFEESQYEGEISNWDISNVIDTTRMFYKSKIKHFLLKPMEISIPTFNQTFLDMAEVISKRSKSKRLKVGAVLVKDNRIIATGYNGLVSGVEPDILEDENGVTKPDVIHAELNCIISCAKNGVSTDGSILYLTHSPCESCAALIAQSGIKEVIYKNEYRKKEGIDNLKAYKIEIKKY